MVSAKPDAPVYFGGKGPDALPWKPLTYMDDYIENLRVDQRSEKYVRSVKIGLTHFGIYCDAENIKHPEELTRQHMLRFQAYCNALTHANGTTLALSYRQQLLKYVRGWINWLEEVGHIEVNPWVRIRIGRVDKKPKPMEDDEISALFETHRAQAFSIPPFFYHRRETILVLLLGWGLRLHELQALTVTSLDMRLDWITARNKGGKTKTLPYSDEMKQVVQRWLVHRSRYMREGEDSLLIDQQGNQLSEAMIRKIVTECGARAGVAINPHRLRDTFGTTMLDHDVEVERIMKIMGHTQRAQTLAYARVNDHKVKESHDRVIDPLISRLINGGGPE